MKMAWETNILAGQLPVAVLSFFDPEGGDLRLFSKVLELCVFRPFFNHPFCYGVVAHKNNAFPSFETSANFSVEPFGRFFLHDDNKPTIPRRINWISDRLESTHPSLVRLRYFAECDLQAIASIVERKSFADFGSDLHALRIVRLADTDLDFGSRSIRVDGYTDTAIKDFCTTLSLFPIPPNRDQVFQNSPMTMSL
jgi:hypothetical protein